VGNPRHRPGAALCGGAGLGRGSLRCRPPSATLGGCRPRAPRCCQAPSHEPCGLAGSGDRTRSPETRESASKPRPAVYHAQLLVLRDALDHLGIEHAFACRTAVAETDPVVDRAWPVAPLSQAGQAPKVDRFAYRVRSTTTETLEALGGILELPVVSPAETALLLAATGLPRERGAAEALLAAYDPPTSSCPPSTTTAWISGPTRSRAEPPTSSSRPSSRTGGNGWGTSCFERGPRERGRRVRRRGAAPSTAGDRGGARRTGAGRPRSGERGRRGAHRSAGDHDQGPGPPRPPRRRHRRVRGGASRRDPGARWPARLGTRRRLADGARPRRGRPKRGSTGPATPSASTGPTSPTSGTGGPRRGPPGRRGDPPAGRDAPRAEA
jgi:hypothetical protein